MKKVLLYSTICIVCMIIGAFVGSIITNNRIHQEMELVCKQQVVQELDYFSDCLLKATVRTYGKLSHNIFGERFPSDVYVVKVAEEIAWFASSFLDEMDRERGSKGIRGDYYYWRDYDMNLIRSEVLSIAQSIPQKTDLDSSALSNYLKSYQSIWEKDWDINKDRYLPSKGPESYSIPEVSD